MSHLNPPGFGARPKPATKLTAAINAARVSEGEGLFSRPLFIRPHRKDICHKHNSDAPRKSNPYIITNRLTRQ